jgi:glycosyltransferase involved in cell wall biosynthesis
MRLVIVTHFFPPDPGPGSVRPHALATALHELGHEVLVLTACRNPVDTPYEVLSLPYIRVGGHVKRMASADQGANLAEMAARRGRLASVLVRWTAHWTEAAFQHPDKYRAWIGALEGWWERDGRHLARPDAVIATTPPVSAAIAGMRLAGRWDCEFVLDVRDLWTDSPYYRFGRLRRAIDRRAERRLFAAADRVVAVTGPLREALAARHGRPDARLVRTGVLVRPPAAPHASGETMLVRHFGSMEDWVRRDPAPVLAAAESLGAEGALDPSRLRFEFYGAAGPAFLASAHALGARAVVEVCGSVPHDEALRGLAEADVALLLMWQGDVQSVPLKATEYMAAGKTVLVSGSAPDAEIRRVLGGVEGVYFCDDETSARAALLACWRRFDAGEPLDLIDPQRARPFLAETMAARFAEIVADAGTSTVRGSSGDT